MTTEEKIEKLETRVANLEGVLTAFLAINFRNIVGGEQWAKRSITILEGNPKYPTDEEITQETGYKFGKE